MDNLHFSKCSDGMASRFKNRKHAALPYMDLLWLDDAIFETMAVPDPDTDRNQKFRVVNFRSLLAMKLFALKDGETRDHKDLLDIRLLLRYGHSRILEEELISMCERDAGAGAYEKIKSES